jgi:hypothetical protein
MLLELWMFLDVEVEVEVAKLERWRERYLIVNFQKRAASPFQSASSVVANRSKVNLNSGSTQEGSELRDVTFGAPLLQVHKS